MYSDFYERVLIIYYACEFGCVFGWVWTKSVQFTIEFDCGPVLAHEFEWCRTCSDEFPCISYLRNSDAFGWVFKWGHMGSNFSSYEVWIVRMSSQKSW